MNRRWLLHTPPEHELAMLGDLPPLIARLLHRRGVRTAVAAQRFLAHQRPPFDPFAMADMPRAVERIQQAIAQGEHIVVHGDFDADGITSTLLMGQTLHALGARVNVYIPHRVDEGYGLNLDAIRRMAQHDVRLLVSVDCGIRAHDVVEEARHLGMDIIITDHHTPADTLPPAVAVVNPRRGDCPGDPTLAGVGVAWMLASALLAQTPSAPISAEMLLDLVAIGTVGDVVPLRGLNRALVAEGLDRLRTAPRPGILALLQQARRDVHTLDAEALAFVVVPRLNAAGRLDHAMLAYHLLRTNNPAKAATLAAKLEAINTERRQRTDALERAALASLTSDEAALIAVAGAEYHPGLVGLVAARLAERFQRPALVLHANGGEWRGSLRNPIEAIDITALLGECAHLLLRYGGHRAAAGVSLNAHNADAFIACLRERLAALLAHLDLTPTLLLDAPLAPQAISPPLLDWLERLQPFGEGNPPPVFLATNLHIEQPTLIGAGDRHIRMRVRDEEGRSWAAIAFNQAYRWQQGMPPVVDLAYSIDTSANFLYDERTLRILDMRAHQAAKGDSL
nr:single-stranded-DNA-specific exonuclease RecJ [Ardenticatena sp.]